MDNKSKEAKILEMKRYLCIDGNLSDEKELDDEYLKIKAAYDACKTKKLVRFLVIVTAVGLICCILPLLLAFIV